MFTVELFDCAGIYFFQSKNTLYSFVFLVESLIVSENGRIFYLRLILENGISLFLWIGLQVNQELLQQLFHANTIGQVDIEMVSNWVVFSV